MVTGVSNFPGRPFRLRVEAWVNWQSGNQASVHTELWIDKLSYSPTYSFDKTSTANQDVQGGRVGNWGPSGFDFRNANNLHLLAQDNMTTVNNDGGMWIVGRANFALLGYTEVGVALYGTALRPPDAPTQHQPTNVTTTSMQVTFSGHGDGGSPITGWELWRATDAGFSQNVHSEVSSGTSQATGLTPGTTYYFRSRGRNAIGLGPFSNTVSQTTLPAVPPGFTVTPGPSGATATIALTPPGGVSGVSSYWVDWRVLGTTAPVTSKNGQTPILVEGLTPGTVYEWQASAMIGSYESPKTAWVQVQQPNPNVSPGDYFDGNSPDRPDVDYTWQGAPNNSVSLAAGRAVAGWMATFGSGSFGVLYQVTGGYASANAARAVINSSAGGAPGITAGMGHTGTPEPRAEVEAGATYVGSIWVNPSRTQRMRAELYWSAEGGTATGTSVGEEVVVPPDTWTRLIVSGNAPAGTDRAAVRASDVAGEGWSAWLGGQFLTVDAAMVSLTTLFDYFDGNTPDTASYEFSWLGTPNQSISARETLDAILVDPLADPDCPPLPGPPVPPQIVDPCITEEGTWRRYWAVIPTSQVLRWVDDVPTFRVTTIDEARQVRVRIYPNPDNLPTSQYDASSGWVSEQIISYIPPATVLTLDGVSERVRASVNGGPALAADHLLYGTGGTPATWPVLECGIGYLVAFDVPLDAAAGNMTVQAALTRRY